jgi:hypothetical protein
MTEEEANQEDLDMDFVLVTEGETIEVDWKGGLTPVTEGVGFRVLGGGS